MFKRAAHAIKRKSPENAVLARFLSCDSIRIKQVLAGKIVEHQKRVNKFVSKHGKKVIDRITVDQVYGGMRGARVLVTETSHLDPDTGIRFRGHPISDCCKRLPKAANGDEPLPEGVFYLLLTGDFPDSKQVEEISRYWAKHADLPTHIVSMLNKFPSNLSPMAQLSAAVTACNTESLFVKAYSDGAPKATYWEYVLEDSMRIIAKLPTIAAIIYRNLYRGGTSIGAIDPIKDWSANFTSMLGFENDNFTELVRFHLTIHSDHEGGNVSSHTAHLVNSTLSDPYLSLAAGINGLAGPLHGLATQEVLTFIDEIIREFGTTEVPDEKLSEFLRSHLKSGRVVPGFGHAVLKQTDPRYSMQREFALKHLPDFPKFKLASQLYKIVPNILSESGKVKNPWPNVDALSGVLLQYYGMKEVRYYPALVSMGRALGVLSSLVWDRAMGRKIVNPDSVTSEALFKRFHFHV